MSRKPESTIAPFLTDLQARVKKEGIRVGSCEFADQSQCFSLRQILTSTPACTSA